MDSPPGVRTQLLNHPTGTISITEQAVVSSLSGSSADIINQGTLAVSTFNGDLDIGQIVQFDNSGTVTVFGGDLTVLTFGTNTGSFDVSGGGNLWLIGNYEFSAGATVTGDGTLRVRGHLTVTDPVTISCPTEINLPGAKITLDSNLTFAADVAWLAGELIGPGSVTVASGATMCISDLFDPTLACTLDNHGTISWDAGEIVMNDGPGTTGTLNNHSDGTFVMNGGTNLTWPNGGTSAFNNMGLINRTNFSISRVAAGVQFNSSGTINIADGTLVILTGQGQLGGIVEFAPAGTLEIASVNGYAFGDVQVIGAGGLVRINGVLDATGAVDIGSAVHHSGMLTGAGDVTISGGNYTWTGGEMHGDGRFILDDGATMSLEGGNLTVDRIFDNHGVINWNNGNLALDNALFNNWPGGTIECFAAAGALTGNSTSAFENDGLFRINTGSAITVGIFLPFNSTGTIELGPVVSSLRILAINGTNTGAIEIGQSSTITYEGSTGGSNYTFADGTTVTGNGVLKIVGQLIIDADLQVSASLVLSGVLDGSGTVTVGLFDWQSGTMTGTGTTLVAPGATARILAGGKTLSRSFNIAGEMLWLGGQVQFSNGALNILPSGVFRCNGGTDLVALNNAQINNMGTFRKETANTVFASPRFTNDGIIDVREDTLYVAGIFENYVGNTLTGGTYIVAGTFRFNNASIVTNNAQIIIEGPSGAVQSHTGVNALARLQTMVAAGVLNAAGVTTLNLNNDLQNFGLVGIGADAVVNIPGDYLPGANSQTQVTLDSAGPMPGGAGIIHGVLAATGAVPLDGGLSIDLAGAAQPPVGSTYDILLGSHVSGQFACLDLPPLADGILDVTYLGDRVRLAVLPGCVVAGDLDRDGLVGISDLLALPAEWGACAGGCCPADLTGDGGIDIQDLLALLSGWGPSAG